MILDADGRIDRDFSSNFNKCNNDAIFVIDDIDDQPFLITLSIGIPCINVISSRLLQYYNKMGIIKVEKIIYNTTFCRKICNIVNLHAIELESLKYLSHFVLLDCPYDLGCLSRKYKNKNKNKNHLIIKNIFNKIKLNVK